MKLKHKQQFSLGYSALSQPAEMGSYCLVKRLFKEVTATFFSL